MLQLAAGQARKANGVFERVILVSAADVNASGGWKHLFSIKSGGLDWDSDIVQGSAQLLREDAEGRLVGRTLVLVDEVQNMYDADASKSADFWNAVRARLSPEVVGKRLGSRLSFIMAATYDLRMGQSQAEDPTSRSSPMWLRSRVSLWCAPLTGALLSHFASNLSLFSFFLGSARHFLILANYCDGIHHMLDE